MAASSVCAGEAGTALDHKSIDKALKNLPKQPRIAGQSETSRQQAGLMYKALHEAVSALLNNFDKILVLNMTVRQATEIVAAKTEDAWGISHQRTAVSTAHH